MKEILVYRFHEVIKAPIDIVFDYLDDDHKIKEWNSYFVENIYEGTNQYTGSSVGAKFKSVQRYGKKTITAECVITEYEIPNKIFIESHTKEGTSITKYLLWKDSLGTRLVIEASIIPSNFYQFIVTKLFGWSTKYVFEEQFMNFKDHVELIKNNLILNR